MGKPRTAPRSGSSNTSKSVKVTPPVSNNDDDGDEDLSLEEENIISASEDEEGSDDERRHANLLQAISSLGAKRRQKHFERSEASLQISEFSLSAEGAGDKIELTELLGTMERTPGAPKKTKKQLKNLKNNKATLELPLSKQQTEKIQRAVAYARCSEEVSQWESVVNQTQKAEQLLFPLKQESAQPKRIEQLVAGWKAQTPLEQEIFKLLHSNLQPSHDPVLTPMEEASIRAMSLDEAKMRRAELQKARALQSYYEAKAKRERKIKSKKYHKVQKKAKRKEFVRQFDEMMKTDPEAALDELQKMERARMEERMSLKHQNSGKWAKSRAIMAKYDETARKSMQEQLQINKDLTQKLAAPPEDEEEEKEEEVNTLPDFVNDAEPAGDDVNPWMRGKLTTETTETSAVTMGTTETTGEEEAKEEEKAEEEEEEEEVNEEEQLLREFETKRQARKALEEEEEEEEGILEGQEETEIDAAVPVAQEVVIGEDVVEISDNEDEEEEEEEEEEENEEVVSEFNSLFNRLMKSGTTAPERERQQNQNQTEDEGLLDEGQVRVRTLEDLEALREEVEVQSGSAGHIQNLQTSNQEEAPPSISKKKKEIDLNQVLTKEAGVIKVSAVPTVVEEEEEEEHMEQTSIIKEAFAGDDVVSDFLKDKRKQEEEGRPKVVDLALPGWGEWGGIGLKVSRKKRKRFRIKAAPAPARKDQKLPAVIISEKRNASIAAHQVSQLPFPFQTSLQFESSIRSPIGQTWNTQTTVKKLTAPKVVTKLGAIIEPIDKEDFIPKKKCKLGEKKADILLGEGKKKEGKSRIKKSQQRKKKTDKD